MKIGIFSHQDYANYGYEVCMALRSVGADVDSYVLVLHGFRYPNQSTQVSMEKMQELVHDYDVIMVMHSCGTTWDMVKEIKDKPIIVWHTGTRYRKDPDKHNMRWNPVASHHICALPEFMKLGCKNPEYFGITINSDDIKPSFRNRSKLTFGHFPSNPKVKGTPLIQSVMRMFIPRHRLRAAFMCDMKKVSYDRQLARMTMCDVYVEMMAPEQDGRKYGSFGTTALEAAAMGKIVITNDCNRDVYENTYGDHVMLIANSPEELRDVCEKLVSLSNDEITDLKQKTRLWIEENHSRKSQGKRLLGIIKRVHNRFEAGKCSPYGLESFSSVVDSGG